MLASDVDIASIDSFNPRDLCLQILRIEFGEETGSGYDIVVGLKFKDRELEVDIDGEPDAIDHDIRSLAYHFKKT